jgi:hypothetical protein
MPEWEGAEALKRALQEVTREALTAEFQKLGLNYASLDPIIRSAMELAAISAGGVRQQVESFLGVARMVDEYDLSDAKKGYALVKAYERHRQTMGQQPIAAPENTTPDHFSAPPSDSRAPTLDSR